MALRGSIEDVPVIDVLQFIHLSGKSGVLVLESTLGLARIAFGRGSVLYAQGPTGFGLGRMLVDAGAVSPAQVEAALVAQRASSPREPLGRLLIASGALDEQRLAQALRKQIQQVMLAVADWRTGDFSFEQGSVEVIDDLVFDAVDVLPLLSINTQYLLLETMRVIDERQEAVNRATTGFGSVTPDGDAAIAALRPAPYPQAPEVRSEPTLVPGGLVTPPSEPVRTRGPMRAGVVFVGFEKGAVEHLRPPLEAAGLRFVGHVPFKEVEKHLVARRAGERALQIVWRLRSSDAEEARAAARLALLERVVERHPDWVHVALPGECGPAFCARLYEHGVRAVLPHDPMSEDTPRALVAILGQVGVESARVAQLQAAELQAWLQAKRVTTDMHRATQRPTISLELMRVAASTFDRAALLLLKNEELLGIGAFGLTLTGRPMAEAIRGLALRVAPGKALARCLEERMSFASATGELGLGSLFFDLVGRPARDEAVLVPLVGPSKVIGLLYGDNGRMMAPLQGIQAIEHAAVEAGVAYEYAVVRRRLHDGDKGMRE